MLGGMNIEYTTAEFKAVNGSDNEDGKRKRK